MAAKFASAEKFPSVRFFFFYGTAFCILGVYALLWQQAIKKFELSVAYTNKAMSLIWTMVWAVLIFHDEISRKNIAGVILIILGTVILNGGQEEKEPV